MASPRAASGRPRWRRRRLKHERRTDLKTAGWARAIPSPIFVCRFLRKRCQQRHPATRKNRDVVIRITDEPTCPAHDSSIPAIVGCVMVGTKAIETINMGAAFSRKRNATPKAYRAREAVIASRITNHGSVLSKERHPASGERGADGAPSAERRCRQARTLDASERASMLQLIPALRAFAVSLDRKST